MQNPMTRLRVHLLLLLVLGASLWATPAAVGVPQGDLAAPGWTSSAQADLEAPERPVHHYSSVLRRARRTCGSCLLDLAHLAPVVAPLDPDGAVSRKAELSASMVRIAPDPLGPYVTTLPPPTHS